jgi:hypothetical protein
MKTLEQIQLLVQNKSILLVGNNETINKSDNSELIDSYDIVVRMNHGIPEPNIGSKTDIWLCSFNNVMRQKKQLPLFNPKYIVRLNADGNIADEIKENLYIWSKENHLKFKEELGSLPSTGCMAIHFFLEYTEPKSVTLIGYDNFETKTYYNSKPIAHLYHDVNKEVEYTNKLIEEGKITKL